MRGGYGSTVFLAVVLAGGCGLQPMNPGDNTCGTEGDTCASDLACCAPLACSNGLCQVPVAAAALPDFSAIDVNPRSPRYEQAVSPRDYLGQISAWYFGHAT